MGHIGNKLLPGVVKHLHPAQHLIERIHDVDSLQIVGNRDTLVRIARLHIIDRLRDTGKGSGHHIRQYHGDHQNDNHHQNLQNQRLSVQGVHGGDNAVRGDAGEHHAAHNALFPLPLVIRHHHGLRDGRGHLDVAMPPVVVGKALPTEGADDLL